MRLARMRRRVSSAEAICIGFVSGYKFVFHKRSQDGSAKADALLTKNCQDRVYGVLYQLNAAEKPILDEHEFLGIGYDQIQVEVTCAVGKLDAWMYTARYEWLAPDLLPYSWYQQYVIHGAIEHRLPQCYVHFLRSHKSCLDPDKQRNMDNFEICSQE